MPMLLHYTLSLLLLPGRSHIRRMALWRDFPHLDGVQWLIAALVAAGIAVALWQLLRRR